MDSVLQLRCPHHWEVVSLAWPGLGWVLDPSTEWQRFWYFGALAVVIGVWQACQHGFGRQSLFDQLEWPWLCFPHDYVLTQLWGNSLWIRHPWGSTFSSCAPTTYSHLGVKRGQAFGLYSWVPCLARLVWSDLSDDQTCLMTRQTHAVFFPIVCLCLWAIVLKIFVFFCTAYVNCISM